MPVNGIENDQASTKQRGSLAVVGDGLCVDRQNFMTDPRLEQLRKELDEFKSEIEARLGLARTTEISRYIPEQDSSNPFQDSTSTQPIEQIHAEH